MGGGGDTFRVPRKETVATYLVGVGRWEYDWSDQAWPGQGRKMDKR